MAIEEVMRELPHALREQIEGYVRFVVDVSEELFAASGVDDPSPSQRETLVTLVTVWRLWVAVDSQFGLLSSTLDLLNQPYQGVGEVTIGGAIYSRGSERFMLLAQLRRDLQALLRTADLPPLSRMHLDDIVDFIVATVS